MIRPERALLGFSLLALVGVVVVVTAIGALLWRASMAAEESRVAELAETLGERVQGVLVDARETLEHLDRLSEPRCSPAHLTAMQDAALPRPYIRTIGRIATFSGRPHLPFGFDRLVAGAGDRGGRCALVPVALRRSRYRH